MDIMQNLFNSYAIETWYSKNDKAFLARIQEIPECMADGQTRAEAIDELYIAFTGWYEFAIEDGDPIPEPLHKADIA